MLCCDVLSGTVGALLYLIADAWQKHYNVKTNPTLRCAGEYVESSVDFWNGMNFKETNKGMVCKLNLTTEHKFYEHEIRVRPNLQANIESVPFLDLYDFVWSKSSDGRVDFMQLQTQCCSLQHPSTNTYRFGDKVRAVYAGNGTEYNAVIVSDGGGGPPIKYEVQWEDGSRNHLIVLEADICYREEAEYMCSLSQPHVFGVGDHVYVNRKNTTGAGGNAAIVSAHGKQMVVKYTIGGRTEKVPSSALELLSNDDDGDDDDDNADGDDGEGADGSVPSDETEDEHHVYIQASSDEDEPNTMRPTVGSAGDDSRE